MLIYSFGMDERINGALLPEHGLLKSAQRSLKEQQLISLHWFSFFLTESNLMEKRIRYALETNAFK